MHCAAEFCIENATNCTSEGRCAIAQNYQRLQVSCEHFLTATKTIEIRFQLNLLTHRPWQSPHLDLRYKQWPEIFEKKSTSFLCIL